MADRAIILPADGKVYLSIALLAPLSKFMDTLSHVRYEVTTALITSVLDMSISCEHLGTDLPSAYFKAERLDFVPPTCLSSSCITR